jgi:hypothetical protein
VFIGRVATLLVGVAATAQLGDAMFADEPVFLLSWNVGCVLVSVSVGSRLMIKALVDVAPWD